ncbi:MAG TPA: hypothetical protein VHM00_02065 [Caldimonas sp.]|jgi:hypothetical protein|nr:hypothetical protein [Caldimonas sp.]HEX2539846.1 hypothetical protein [Caldimonas sp.]
MAGVDGPAPVQAAGPPPVLEQRLTDVESRLAALGNALRARDPAGIDLHAAELHRALASAVTEFTDAARSGRVPADLRTRLANASGQVAAQRESLARATAALDRAIDVLLPQRDNGTLYSAYGAPDRGLLKSGVISA